MKKMNIIIAGGDTRQLFCAARLTHEYSIGVIGFDSEYLPEGISLPSADISQAGRYDCAVLPVPPINDNGDILAPCSSRSIPTDMISMLLKDDGCILAGKVSDELRDAFPDRDIMDYMLREELSLRNSVPTAEGAVQIALEELPVTLSGLDVLIVGLGRIGMALAEILKGFGAHVTAAVHNPRGAAKAKLCGISSIPTRRINGGYRLVFNTVPHLIFDRDILSRFSNDTLFIDLASKPGGIDFDSAASLGLRAVWALGLPGRTAPVTAGEIIAETVSSMLEERRGGHE